MIGLVEINGSGPLHITHAVFAGDAREGNDPIIFAAITYRELNCDAL